MTEVKQVDRAKPILRARFQQDTGSDVKESVPQQIADTESAELFSYVPVNGELGKNNSIFLHNRLNDKIRYSNADQIPQANIPNTLGFSSQMNSDKFVPPMDSIIDRARPVVAGQILTSIPNIQGSAMLPGSNLMTRDAFTGRIQNGIFIDTQMQPDKYMMNEATFNPLPVFSNNKIGLKPYYDQWRTPLAPSKQQTPILPLDKQLSMSLMVGPQIY